MNRSHLASRLFILAVALAAAFVSSSCSSSEGIGQGVPYGARWGGSGSAGPPVFVGGPSF